MKVRRKGEQKYRKDRTKKKIRIEIYKERSKKRGARKDR
jgi:hypothetical protein